MTTIEEIRAMDDVLLKPETVSRILKCSPQSIRIAARERPDLLGFPVIVMGKETRIPRIPFLRFLGVE